MDELHKYALIREYEVHWGDMDAANHVNNTVYLRWAESVRIEYFAAMGMDISFSGIDVGPILGWLDCKYIFPITYPDWAVVGARTIEIKEDRFIMECAIFSKKHARIAAISKQSIIPYSYGDLVKVDIPENWLESIEKLNSQRNIEDL